MSETQALLRITVKEEVTTQMKKAREELDRVSKSASNTQRFVKDMFREFAGPVATAGAAAAIGLIAKESVAAAEDLNILHNRASVIFGTDFPRMTQESERLGAQFRRSGSDMLEFTTNFSTLLTGVGFGKKAAEEMSTELTKLSVNLAKSLGKSDAEGFDVLQAAMRGNARELGRLNIIMNDSTLQEFAHAKGIKQKVSEMNEAQQMALRHAFLQAKSNEIDAIALKNTGGLTDQWHFAQGALHDLNEEVGKPFLGQLAMTAGIAAEAFTGLARAIRGAGDAFASMQGNDPFNPFNQAIKDRKANEWTGSVGHFGTDAKGSLTRDRTQVLSEQDKKLKDIIGSLGGAGKAADGAAKEMEKLKEQMADLGDDYDDAVAKVSEDLAELEMQHEDKMAGIVEEIEGVTKALDDMKKKYKETMDDISGDEFESVAKQQEKIAKLKRELDDATFFSGRTGGEAFGMLSGLRQGKDLGDVTKTEQHGFGWSDETVSQVNAFMQLQKEQAALDKVLGGRSDKDALLAGAGTEASKSDFEKEFEKFDKRREQEREHYQESLKEKQDELQKLQEKKVLEQEVYTLQRQELQSTTVALQFFHDDWTTKMANMQSVTSAAVKQMKKDLEDIQSIMSSTQALQRAKFNVDSGVDDRRAARAGGGTITESATWVGEYGPELVSLPYGSRVHTAAESRGMGGQVTIQFGDVYVSNEADENRFARKVEDVVTRLLQRESLASA